MEYVYGIDKGTNEFITLGIYKKNGEKIEKFEFPDTVGVYRITEIGCKKTHVTIRKIDNLPTTHYLYKNPAQFLTEYHPEYIDDSTVFEKKLIVSCLGNLTSAKVIGGKIILNGDMNTIFSLYKTAAKREIYESVTQGKCTAEDRVTFDPERNIFTF